MKVATWNIAGGRTYLGHHPEAMAYGYGRENMQYFAESLRRAKPDVVVLQEVHVPHISGPSQAHHLANVLEYHTAQPVAYSDSHIQDDQKLSLATLSRSPLRDNSFHQLPHLDLTIIRPNGEQWVSFSPTGFHVSEIEHEGEIVRVVNGHLHPFHYFEKNFSDSEFQHYRDAISDFFLSLADTPTIIAGDFNYADLQSLFPRVFEEGLYQSALIGSTTPEKGQQDHILFSRHWELRSSFIDRGSADHYLCVADLSLKKNPD